MVALDRRVSPWFLLLVTVAVSGGVMCLFAGSASEPLGIAGIFVLALAGWAVSLCLHEYGHAIVAYRGGDTSVATKGYLTLDLRRYTDVGLSLVLPLIILLIGGLPLPGGAVWINQAALRTRARRAAVSLAGPAANLVLGLVLIVVVATVPMPGVLGAGLSVLALLQIAAFVLNMLPVPGLDGWGVLEPYLSLPAQRFGVKVRPWAPFALLAVLIFLPGAGSIFFFGMFLAYSLVGGDVAAASDGFGALLFWRSI